jgi:hypothetical protein
VVPVLTPLPMLAVAIMVVATTTPTTAGRKWHTSRHLFDPSLDPVLVRCLLHAAVASMCSQQQCAFACIRSRR